MNLKFTDSGNAIVDYLTIGDEAFNKIKEILQQRQGDCDGIKVGVRTRGCSGLSYTIEYAQQDKNISKFDDVAIRDDVKVFIDPKISMFLIDSEMVYKENDLESGFDFINPNEKGRCGCGESFNT